MAEQSSKATIKCINQVTRRPFDWHVWDITINDANAIAADTILLPEKYTHGHFLLMPWVQKLVLSNATTCTLSVRQIKVAYADGTITDLSSPVIGAGLIDMKVSDTYYPGSSTTTWQAQFNDAGIVAGTHYGALRFTVDAKTGGPGTANMRLLFGVLMGRTEY